MEPSFERVRRDVKRSLVRGGSASRVSNPFLGKVRESQNLERACSSDLQTCKKYRLGSKEGCRCPFEVKLQE